MKPFVSTVRHALVLGALFGMIGLVGCSTDERELGEWMKEQRALLKPNVVPVARPRQFVPRPYEMADKVDPFNPQKLQAVLDRSKKHPCPLLLAEQSRKRQPLESYPLDTMSMVGFYVKGGQQFALLNVSDHLYPAKVGDYIGQNYGKIIRVTESEVSLREIGQDPAGDCEERPGTLQLQEKSR